MLVQGEASGILIDEDKFDDGMDGWFSYSDGLIGSGYWGLEAGCKYCPSLWCAAQGSSTGASPWGHDAHYDNEMYAQVEKTFNFQGYRNCYLEFDYYIYVEDARDFLFLFVNDTYLNSYTGYYNWDPAEGGEPSHIDLGDYDNTSSVTIRFVFYSNSTGNQQGAITCGAFLDNIKVGGDRFQLEPDLHLISGPTPDRDRITLGRDVNVSATVKNEGDGIAGPSQVGYYIGTSPTSTTHSIGTSSVGTLSAGSASSVDEDCVISGDIPASPVGVEYYLVAKADSSGAVDESDEGNNTRAHPTLVTIYSPPDPWLYGPADQVLLDGETADLLFSVVDNGGYSPWGGLSISCSSGLEMIRVDGMDFDPDQHWVHSLSETTYTNYSIGDTHLIATADGGEIVPEDQLLEISRAYEYAQVGAFTVRFRAKPGSSASPQWIKHRVYAADTDGFQGPGEREPESGQTDQQGWPAAMVNVGAGNPHTAYEQFVSDMMFGVVKRGDAIGEAMLYLPETIVEDEVVNAIVEVVLQFPVDDANQWRLLGGTIQIAYDDSSGEVAGEVAHFIRQYGSPSWDTFALSDPFLSQWGPIFTDVAFLVLGFVPGLNQIMEAAELPRKLSDIAMDVGEATPDPSEFPYAWENQYDFKAISLPLTPTTENVPAFRTQIPLRFTRSGVYPFHASIHAQLQNHQKLVLGYQDLMTDVLVRLHLTVDVDPSEHQIRGDITGDGKVDARDFAIFADHWLEGTGD